MTDVKSPQQFKLFMTGTEWKNQVTKSTDGPLDSVWQEKTEQASSPGAHHGAGLKADIEKRGYVHDPMNKPTIIIEENFSGTRTDMVQSDGHHRIAAMAASEAEGKGPYFIPTNYVDNTRAGRAARGA